MNKWVSEWSEWTILGGAYTAGWVRHCVEWTNCERILIQNIEISVILQWKIKVRYNELHLFTSPSLSQVCPKISHWEYWKRKREVRRGGRGGKWGRGGREGGGGRGGGGGGREGRGGGGGKEEEEEEKGKANGRGKMKTILKTGKKVGEHNRAHPTEYTHTHLKHWVVYI